MTPILQITCAGAKDLADVTAGLEQAAIAHAIDLHIDHDRMLSEFGCLWMIARSSVRLERLPEGEFQVTTWLRKPTAAISNRDFSLRDSEGEFGSAVQSWVLADAEHRKLVNLKTIPVLWELPAPEPERTELPKRFKLPQELSARAEWTIDPTQIDGNGHLNNVWYIRRAESLAPQNCLALDVSFDRECFLGETLTLEAGLGDGFFVRGVKGDGLESFRARFGGSL